MNIYGSGGKFDTVFFFFPRKLRLVLKLDRHQLIQLKSQGVMQVVCLWC